MLNLFKSDFYKILKSKSLKVCWLIMLFLAVLIPVINNAMMDQMTEAAKTQPDMILPIFDGFKSIFLSISGGGGNVMIVLAILAAIFISSEFTNGTMKNIASKAYSRTQIYLSKLLVILIANTVILLSFIACSAVTGTILWGFGTAPDDAVSKVLTFLGVEIILFLGLTALFTMIGMLIRNVGGAIAVNICIYMFATIIISLLQYFVFKDSEISKYWIINNTIMAAETTVTSETLRISIVNGLIFLIAPSLIGGFFFNKNDIK